MAAASRTGLPACSLSLTHMAAFPLQFHFKGMFLKAVKINTRKMDLSCIHETGLSAAACRGQMRSIYRTVLDTREEPSCTDACGRVAFAQHWNTCSSYKWFREINNKNRFLHNFTTNKKCLWMGKDRTMTREEWKFRLYLEPFMCRCDSQTPLLLGFTHNPTGQRCLTCAFISC